MEFHWTWTLVDSSTARFGDNVVYDWIRVGCVVLGFALVWWIGRVVVEQQRRSGPMPRGQVLRFVALALAGLSITASEIAIVGTPATPILFVNVACLLTGLFGVRGMRCKQQRQPIVKGR